MKFSVLTILLATILTLNDFKQLEIGDKAPIQNLKLFNINDEVTALQFLKQEKGLCVVFSCNSCPWVIAWEDRYNDIYDVCRTNGVGFVLVNSNEAKRDSDDSFEQMKIHAQEKGYADFAYVMDKNHMLADAFGATKTPDVFLFNGDMELVYKGAIDDNSKDKSSVSEPYLINAVKALSKGEQIDPATTKALGCSIKRIKS